MAPAFELVVGEGGAVDGAPDRIAVPAIGQVASVAAVGPFPQGARQRRGADPVMGADEPGFDVAEQGMDNRQAGAGIGGLGLDDRRVLGCAPRSASRL
jgi:hypothetical protein